MHSQQELARFREIIRLLGKNINFFDKFGASCCGISASQWQVIWEIGSAGEISLNEVAALLNLDSSTMSRAINNLAAQDVVQRQTDPVDRRYVKIHLTPKGMDFYRRMEEMIERYYGTVLYSIPADKRNQVTESLELLLKALQENKCC
ncbi:MarR family winged helix-turn-helix transcriptional regulator [Dethiobacter alkaliphilus]|uniref:Transcriptional regulator, MarR family n=1 Tax=Dethiobacter alkaliphilus AHT 1 TaxID=555088 RepID=C0GKZ9_DETAL|nr:MarR family transcriptional regulator [Dethiobacter alkaliphilus]EEG75986.1 transcriptional regulator, MarR family [Dethiobacter alkaliphilus AHT 1]